MRPSYLLFNTVMILVAVGGLMFSIFSTKLDLVQNRLQLSFILLLSTFTFQNSVHSVLPKVSYLTYLGEHTSACAGTARLCDYIALGILSFFYIRVHTGFIISWVVTVSSRKRMKQLDLIANMHKCMVTYLHKNSITLLLLALLH